LDEVNIKTGWMIIIEHRRTLLKPALEGDDFRQNARGLSYLWTLIYKIK
jgi:hypothetical protein